MISFEMNHILCDKFYGIWGWASANQRAFLTYLVPSTETLFSETGHFVSLIPLEKCDKAQNTVIRCDKHFKGSDYF